MHALSAEHRLIYSDPYAYSAHPHAVRDGLGQILIVFNRAPRRSVILHPPQDPYFENVLVRSADGGRTWSVPSVVPDYGWSGVECAGLTVARNGRVLLNQWRFRWYPLAAARRRPATEKIAFPAEWVGDLATSLEIDSGTVLAADPERLAPWARAAGRTWVHLSDDGGETFPRAIRIDTSPYSGGYGMRGAVTLDDGTLVLPLADIPEYERVFVVRSADNGESWGAPIPVAAEPGCLFEEPAALVLPSGRILMALRENRRRTIFTVFSDDAGLTWSRPTATGVDGYPAHLLLMQDGRILCTYGFRRPPFAIRAVLSENGGGTWRLSETIGIRENLPNKDLGYPCTIPVDGGALMTIYYAEDDAGVTGIWATEWTSG